MMANLALELPQGHFAPVTIEVNSAKHLDDDYIRTSFARFLKLARRLE